MFTSWFLSVGEQAAIKARNNKRARTIKTLNVKCTFTLLPALVLHDLMKMPYLPYSHAQNHREKSPPSSPRAYCSNYDFHKPFCERKALRIVSEAQNGGEFRCGSARGLIITSEYLHSLGEISKTFDELWEIWKKWRFAALTGTKRWSRKRAACALLLDSHLCLLIWQMIHSLTNMTNMHTKQQTCF